MTVSDWGVIIALAFSGGALSLQLRRWKESKPKLVLRLMADAMTFPEDDGRKKLALTVVNQGSMPTTITHMIAFYSRSPFHKFFRKYNSTGIVKDPSQVQPIPHEVGINQSWHGVMEYNDELMCVRDKGQLYVGVFANHESKEILIRVSPSRNLPAKQIG